jgi:hypothetical protein
MIHFTTGSCEIHTSIQGLKKFSNDTYHRYHKSSRLKHMVLSDDRYPNLKVTSDIFSLQIWIITCDGEEQRIFLDGDVFLNKAVVHTVSVEGAQFTEETYEEFNRVLKDLSQIGTGYIYAEIDKSPVRYEKGKVTTYPALLNELYQAIPDDQKETYRILLENLQEGFTRSDY